MQYWFLLIPFIGALVGWLIMGAVVKLLFRPYQPRKLLGFTIQGILPKRQSQIAAQAGRLAGEFFSINELEQRVNDPANLADVMPMIEAHIDDFLQNKISKEMPFLSMFIGNKTIGSLKKIFMQEIGDLLPKVVAQFAGNLKKNMNPEQLIVKKLTEIPTARIEEMFTGALSREYRNLRLVGALIGFIIGVFQVIITLVLT